jgi:hypothetical protein
MKAEPAPNSIVLYNKITVFTAIMQNLGLAAMRII